MIIWGAMVIPILAMVVLAIFFSKKLAWPSYVVMILVPMAFIGITKSLVDMAEIKATEYLGGYMIRAEFHEYWREWEHEICTEQYACGEDSEGNTEYCTRVYDCSHYEDHPEYWEAFDSNGHSWQIPKNSYDDFVKLFGNKAFVNLDHATHYDMSRSDCVDGNEYETHLIQPCQDSQLVITSVSHEYENKVQASKSVFNFPAVDPKALKLVDRPIPSAWHQDVILGDPGPTKAAGEAAIGKLDGTLGKASKARVYVIVFKDRPMQSAFDQQAYWKNGHKNEIDICIGVDKDYQVTWARVFGWTKMETLKADIESHLMGQKALDLGELGTWLYPKIQGKVIRRDFKEFDYVTIEPSPGWTIFAYIFTLCLCVFIGWLELVAFKDYQPGDSDNLT